MKLLCKMYSVNECYNYTSVLRDYIQAGCLRNCLLSLCYVLNPFFL